MSTADHRASRCRCISDGARAALFRILTVTSRKGEIREDWTGGVRWLARDLGRAHRNARRYVAELRELGWLAGEDPLRGQAMRLTVTGCPTECRFDCAGAALCDAFVIHTQLRADDHPHALSEHDLEVLHEWSRSTPGRRRPSSFGPDGARKNGTPGARKNGTPPRARTARGARKNGTRGSEGTAKGRDVDRVPAAGVSTCGRVGCTDVLPCRICVARWRLGPGSKNGDKG